MRFRLPPETDGGLTCLTLGAELGGLAVAAADGATEGRAEVEVIIVMNYLMLNLLCLPHA